MVIGEIMGTCLISFDVHEDSRGSLIAVEQFKEIPFEIKRVYYMWGTDKGIVRGKHAHKDLQQVLICLNGSCKVSTFDGKTKTEYNLKNPKDGLLISGLVWREMYDFSQDAVLMVIASDHYNEDDYIRDYETFLELVRNS